MLSQNSFGVTSKNPTSPPKVRTRESNRSITAILAPHDLKQGSSQSTTSRGLSDMLRGVLGRQANEDLVIKTAERAKEADRIEEMEKAKKASAPPADVSAFLRHVGVMELRYIRMLSHLSATTYAMDKLTDANLHRRHGLRLITTSLACDIGLRANAQGSPRKVLAEGDAMAADPITVFTIRESLEDQQSNRQQAMPTEQLKPLADVQPLAVPKGNGPRGPSSAADIVANSLSVAAGAAAAAAGPLASNISLFTTSVTSSMPIRSVAAQLQSAAAAGHSTAVATVATVAAALETSFRSNEKTSSAAKLSRDCNSPTAWFVADNSETATRYFVIQGSDNLDHWKVNLTFDPVAFEDPSMGIKVHRGVYETAQILYDRFLPLVREHRAARPNAKFCFTGHSLGGSLGTLLALMYVRRGVLPRSALTPVYTFGAPAVFCEAEACLCAEDGSCRCDLETPGVLARLGLPEGAVRNVMMHKDVVPRAFACDYSLVADLLKRVESFRQHKCLSGARQLLFNFIGKVIILQPGDDMKFVAGEGLHPMLPEGPGVYFLRPPPPPAGQLNVATMDVMASIDPVGSDQDGSFSQEEALVKNVFNSIQQQQPASTATTASSTSDCSDSAMDGSPIRSPATLSDAVWEIMNNPHPLDILSDPAAYGPTGGISRYHNPDNYTKALGGVLRSKKKGDWRKLVQKAATVGIKYHVPEVVRDVNKEGKQVVDEEDKLVGGKGHLGLHRHLHA